MFAITRTGLGGKWRYESDYRTMEDNMPRSLGVLSGHDTGVVIKSERTTDRVGISKRRTALI